MPVSAGAGAGAGPGRGGGARATPGVAAFAGITGAAGLARGWVPVTGAGVAAGLAAGTARDREQEAIARAATSRPAAGVRRLTATL